ncbi:hypothetical protein MKY37_16245 [Psychrobacillus sp. FSL K6-2836]|uniref:hypothetical protein n=1 Tax=Psychrobacillus sp. FSL K6-2836 TaxID=2921548 RepID=UPI0030FC32D4
MVETGLNLKEWASVFPGFLRLKAGISYFNKAYFCQSSQFLYFPKPRLLHFPIKVVQ